MSTNITYQNDLSNPKCGGDSVFSVGEQSPVAISAEWVQCELGLVNAATG